MFQVNPVKDNNPDLIQSLAAWCNRLSQGPSPDPIIFLPSKVGISNSNIAKASSKQIRRFYEGAVIIKIFKPNQVRAQVHQTQIQMKISLIDLKRRVAKKLTS